MESGIGASAVSNAHSPRDYTAFLAIMGGSYRMAKAVFAARFASYLPPPLNASKYTIQARFAVRLAEADGEPDGLASRFFTDER